MKNVSLNVKEKLISKYLVKDPSKSSPKSSNINVLLNRIEVNKKNEHDFFKKITKIKVSN